jgi:hypothetical protein
MMFGVGEIMHRTVDPSHNVVRHSSEIREGSLGRLEHKRRRVFTITSTSRLNSTGDLGSPPVAIATSRLEMRYDEVG